jgi:hypothetical protein
MRRLTLCLLLLGGTSCGGAHRARIPSGAGDEGAAAPAALDSAAAATSAAAPAADVASPAPAADAAPPPPTGPELGAAMRTSGGGSYSLAATDAAGLSREDASKAVGDAGPQADKCYEKLFKKKKEASGKTTLEIKVDPKGKTKGVKVASDDLKDKAHAKCLQGAFGKIAWPKPTEKGGGKVTVELTAGAPKLGAPPSARAGTSAGRVRGRAAAADRDDEAATFSPAGARGGRAVALGVRPSARRC